MSYGEQIVRMWPTCFFAKWYEKVYSPSIHLVLRALSCFITTQFFFKKIIFKEKLRSILFRPFDVSQYLSLCLQLRMNGQDKIVP